MRAVDDDEVWETPPVVIGAISAGVGPLPFLGIYAVLFISRGLVYPVQPPDITSSQTGEAIAGFVAAVLFVGLILALWWFAGRRRRWPFVLAQLATLITSIVFIVDETTGSPAVPFVLVLTSLTALVLAFHPDAWRHMRSTPRLWPGGRKQRYVGRRRHGGEGEQRTDGAAGPAAP